MKKSPPIWAGILFFTIYYSCFAVIISVVYFNKIKIHKINKTIF